MCFMLLFKVATVKEHNIFSEIINITQHDKIINRRVDKSYEDC